MDDFADQLDDGNEVKNELIRALNRRKPFNGFKNVIDNSGVYRQQWFDFKDARMRQWVIDKFREAASFYHSANFAENSNTT